MIAVDVMGGDYAPHAVLQGALKAAHHVPVMLIGPTALIRAQLTTFDPLWEKYNIVLCDAPDVIAMGEEPIQAVRKKRTSSLVSSIECVKSGQAIAAVSAGNSGACMAAATFILGRNQDIERPAIAGFLPTKHNTQVFALDLGANTECRPSHLYQFAHMGSDYIKRTLGIANPRVALLANGSEDTKGSLVVKETFNLLKKSTLNFIGNVEPYDIFDHKTDIVVCDGFVGNILLKTMEAVFDTALWWITEAIKSEKDSTTKTIVAHWARSLSVDMSQRLTHKTAGGALLLGVQGTVVVCHGNSDADTIEKAILFAWRISNQK